MVESDSPGQIVFGSSADLEPLKGKKGRGRSKRRVNPNQQSRHLAADINSGLKKFLNPPDLKMLEPNRSTRVELPRSQAIIGSVIPEVIKDRLSQITASNGKQPPAKGNST